MATSQPNPSTRADPPGAPGIAERLAERARAVTRRLDEILPPVSGSRGRVVEAMRYSALSDGKRLRPFLVMESAELFDVAPGNALQCAAAVEMIHCYSLIHDDLPAMDDSDLRRGRPTVHKAFDDDGNALDKAYDSRVTKFLDEYEWYATALRNARDSQVCDKELPTQQKLCRGD